MTHDDEGLMDDEIEKLEVLDDLRDMSEADFEHVYEMTKRDACVKWQVEPYALGYQDGRNGNAEDNVFHSALNRVHYDQGYREGMRRHAADSGVIL